eukprot:gene1526-1921_t
MTSLADSSYLEGGSLYYSDLPIRSHVQKDKYKHWCRRILFYLLLAYFITATINFVGSYVIMVTSIILLVILNPDFIATRAKLEGHSVASGWILNILIHWIPPVLLTGDLFLHRDHIRKRHLQQWSSLEFGLVQVLL